MKDSPNYFWSPVANRRRRKYGGVGMRRSDFTVPILLLAMDLSSDMGGSLRERAWPIPHDGHGVSRTKAAAVHLSFLSIHVFLAAASLLLAPFFLWSVPQLQVTLLAPLLSLPNPQFLDYFILIYFCRFCWDCSVESSPKFESLMLLFNVKAFWRPYMPVIQIFYLMDFWLDAMLSLKGHLPKEKDYAFKFMKSWLMVWTSSLYTEERGHLVWF